LACSSSLVPFSTFYYIFPGFSGHTQVLKWYFNLIKKKEITSKPHRTLMEIRQMYNQMKAAVLVSISFKYKKMKQICPNFGQSMFCYIGPCQKKRKTNRSYP